MRHLKKIRETNFLRCLIIEFWWNQWKLNYGARCPIDLRFSTGMFSALCWFLADKAISFWNFLTYRYNLPEIIDSLSSNLLFILFMQIKSITYSHICVICTCIMGSRNHKRVQWHITNNMAIFIHPIGSQTHAVHFHCPISWT